MSQFNVQTTVQWQTPLQKVNFSSSNLRKLNQEINLASPIISQERDIFAICAHLCSKIGRMNVINTAFHKWNGRLGKCWEKIFH